MTPLSTGPTPMDSMRAALEQSVRAAGAVLLEHRGPLLEVRVKDSRSSIVTPADLAADRCVADLVRCRFPTHSLLTEESGHRNSDSEYTWVVDPLDGTSNFAAGLPWFGVMIAVFRQTTPILAALYLPVGDTLYLAEAGAGATRNGKPLRLPAASDLAQVLCGFGMDGGADAGTLRAQALALARLAHAARNVRATNSLVDFTLTLDGALGACVNFHTKIWDIAAPWLVFREAGGLMTGLRGEPLSFSLGPDACDRSYQVAAGSLALHPALLAALAWEPA